MLIVLNLIPIKHIDGAYSAKQYFIIKNIIMLYCIILHLYFFYAFFQVYDMAFKLLNRIEGKMSGIIKMDNVSYYYKDNKKVLNNICISIDKGEIFGLLGPSGAGKTTIIKLLTGQLEAFEQKIQVMGERIQNLNRNYYLNIGMVMDTIGLYERLTCFENLKVMAKIYNINFANINMVLKEVDLYEAAGKEVYKLSSGMKQRLLLARALIYSPQILFLDEPTRGLDPSTAEEIHNLLLKVKEQGTTIFLTTHNMNEADKLCNKIGLLFKGRIVEYGSPKKIRNKYFVNKNVKITIKDKEYILNQNKEKNDIIELLRKNEISSIHSLEPTLEEIFIKLTGEDLCSDTYNE